MTSRMPRYDVNNDGAGPYAIFYCDNCSREFRSQPDIGNTVVKDVGRRVASDALRKIPLFGSALANNVVGEDARYTRVLNPQQLEAAWKQVEEYFHLCPTCQRMVCPSCYDAQTGYCTEDSPRSAEIAEAQTQQAVGVVKGIASAFGFTEAVRSVSQVAQAAAAASARCPADGTLAPAGTKFCPECGTAMVQPAPAAADVCPKCGAKVQGAKFCPECGAKIERAAVCPECGKPVGTAKFCPECGAKVV